MNLFQEFVEPENQEEERPSYMVLRPINPQLNCINVCLNLINNSTFSYKILFEVECKGLFVNDL